MSDEADMIRAREWLKDNYGGKHGYSKLDNRGYWWVARMAEFAQSEREALEDKLRLSIAAEKLASARASEFFEDNKRLVVALESEREAAQSIPIIEHETGKAVQADCLKHGMSVIEAFGNGKYQEGWQTAHDPRECGHPLACWQDRNYPASEDNYDPETHTSDPPMDYRCVICEALAKLESEQEAGRREGIEQAATLCEKWKHAKDIAPLLRALAAEGGK